MKQKCNFFHNFVSRHVLGRVDKSWDLIQRRLHHVLLLKNEKIVWKIRYRKWRAVGLLLFGPRLSLFLYSDYKERGPKH